MTQVKEKTNSKKNNQIKQIVFVGGAARSGTTLLQAMLNVHKSVFGGPEFGYLGKVCELRSMINSSTNPINKLDVYFSKEELNNKFRDFVINLLKNPCLLEGKEIISEKSPTNILVFSELYKFFPDAKFLFVIRDPRAIYSSLKEIKIRANENKNNKVKVPHYSANIYNSISYINKSWIKGFQFVEEHPDNSLIIAYEDIVLNPQDTTKKICKFLEIEWDPNMLNHSNQMTKIVKDDEDNIWGGAQMYHQKVHNHSIDKWKQNLSSSEICIVEKRIFKNAFVQKKYFDNKNFSSKKDFFSYAFFTYFWKKTIDVLKRKTIIKLKKIAHQG